MMQCGTWLNFSPPHVEFVVSHAEGEDAFVDSQFLGEESEVWGFFVDGFYHKFLVVEGDVPDFRPRESNLKRIESSHRRI